MIYNQEKKIVFTAIPKTGTRSVYQVLRGKYDFQMYKEHCTSIPEYMKDYYSFTIVRNPYDRIVSMWWSTCKRDLIQGKNNAGDNFRKLAESDNLADLLKYMISNPYDGKGSELFTKQSDYLKHNRFDMILTNENLNEEFKTLPFLNKGESLPNINSTTTNWGRNTNPRKSDSWNYINQEVLDLINEYYAEDFEMLPQYEKILKI